MEFNYSFIHVLLVFDRVGQYLTICAIRKYVWEMKKCLLVSLHPIRGVGSLALALPRSMVWGMMTFLLSLLTTNKLYICTQVSSCHSLSARYTWVIMLDAFVFCFNQLLEKEAEFFCYLRTQDVELMNCM